MPLNLCRVAAACVVAFALAACKTSQVAVPRTVFLSVTVIPIDRPGALANHDVVVAEGRIVAIGKSGSVELDPTDRLIDAKGKYLMPGLWDMHVHATHVSGLDPRQTTLPLYLSYGIVGVRDMGSTLEMLPALRDAPADRNLPDVVAGGPLLDGPKRPYQHAVALPLADAKAARQAVKDLKHAGVDFLKVYDGLSPEQHAAIFVEAGRAQLTVAGHIPLSMTFEQVTQAGQRSIEHVSLKLIENCTPGGDKAMRTMLDRWIREGFEGKYKEIAGTFARRDTAACEALFERVAGRGAFVTPTLGLEMIGGDWTTQEDLAALPPDARAACQSQIETIAAGTPANREQAFDALQKVTRELHAAGVALLAGSDTANTCLSHGRSLHKELQLLRSAGLSNQQVLETATINVARYLGRGDEGIVRTGATANLLLLEANPLLDVANTLKISGVMKRGVWHDKAELTETRDAAAALLAG